MNIFPRLTRLSARQLAGLSLLYNLPFALLKIHRGAFDTYIHIFLADHYRRSWFDLWEPRWYMGFSVASYPPLVHQLIALLSWPTGVALRWIQPGSEPFRGAWRWQSEEAAYVLVLLGVLVLIPLAVRAFARLFVGPRAANLAGLLAVVAPGLSLVLWSFGQLPSVMATGFILLAMTRGHRYLPGGRPRHLWQAVTLAAVAAATHHGVFLFVPFAGAAAVAQVLMRRRGAGGLGNKGVAVQGREGLRRLLARLLAWISLSALAVAVVLWPLLQWSRGQTLQVPIDHLSRHNLLHDFKATIFFFWPVYGPLLLVLPWVVWAAVRVRRLRLLAPAALALVLLVMGLGGTTPLPQLLYGAGWEWLTYERFGFWAALALLPLAAAALVLVARREPWVAGLFLGAMLIVSILAGGLATLSKAQPPAVDLGAIARFLDQPEQQPYRYFTLGFGDQLAKLSALTSNGTPDGTYHTARGLPELRSSGLGPVDSVMWSHTAAAAGPFLAKAQRYGARWAFVNHPDYPPVLTAAGWTYRFDIGPVQAWEKEGVTPVPAVAPPGLNRSPAAWWWGLVPLAVLALATFTLVADRPWTAWRATWTRARLLETLRTLRLCAWGLTIALLTLWWYHAYYQGATPWVYFVYQSALVFASDVMAALTVLLWLAERVLRGERLRLGPVSVLVGGLGLIAASALSLQDTVNVRLTLALLGHLWLLAAWYVMLVNDPPTPRVAGGILLGVMGTQAVVALAQAATQTTAWLGGLHLTWPGALIPETSGASVVQTAGGGRWLRAYGTLSHPNILGGYLILGLGAALERFRATRGRLWLGVAWLLTAALLLTFSRSAWIGAGVMLAVAFWLLGYRRPIDWRRVSRWAAAGLGALTLLSLPLAPLLLARVNLGTQPLRLEQRSLDDRARLALAAAQMLADRPHAGVGGGAFVVRLYQVAGVDLPLEPAHNVPLLIAAELGVPGVVALAVLAAAISRRLWRRRRAGSVASAELWMAAVLVGVLVTGLFDHYWWTMPPARMALVTVLGLWVGWGQARPLRTPARGETAPPAAQSAGRPRG